jgi:transcriptional regulator with XRE-family HTH domain
MKWAGRRIKPHVQVEIDALGGRLRVLRHSSGLSQRALEARSGVSQSVICRLENGKAPGLRLDRLAAILAVIQPSDLREH